MKNKYYKERGIVLLVALIILLLVTVLGLTSVRILIMEERMSANSFDRNIAFQSAETALRAGEIIAGIQSLKESGPNYGFPTVAMLCNNLNNGSCSNGLCSQPHPNCNLARLESDEFAGWVYASVGVAAISPLAPGKPQFFVEHLGSGFPCEPKNTTQNLNCQRYRITARSHDPFVFPERSVVVLQSIYATD